MDIMRAYPLALWRTRAVRRHLRDYGWEDEDLRQYVALGLAEAAPMVRDEYSPPQQDHFLATRAHGFVCRLAEARRAQKREALLTVLDEGLDVESDDGTPEEWLLAREVIRLSGRPVDATSRNRLREHRLRAGMTLAEASSATGLTVSAISRHENGSRSVSRANLSAYADAYGVDVGDVYGAG
jgi:DNA-binding XRE family transcriptional regulator